MSRSTKRQWLIRTGKVQPTERDEQFSTRGRNVRYRVEESVQRMGVLRQKTVVTDTPHAPVVIEPMPESQRRAKRVHKRGRIKAYRKQSKANARALRQAAYRAWNDPEWRAQQNERRAQLIALGAIQPRKSEMNRSQTA